MRIRSEGFALLEVLFAVALLTALFVGIAQVFAASTRANSVARHVTLATVAAVEKLEQLRALPFDDAALMPSPPGVLRADVDGYSDSPLEGYIRRWSIELLPTYPATSVVVSVLVSHRADAGEVRLVTIKTRK